MEILNMMKKKYLILLLLVVMLTFVMGCENIPSEDIASRIQAKYDDINSIEMEVTDVKITGSHPGGEIRSIPVPIILTGNTKVQKPDKYFISNPELGDYQACLGNHRASSVPSVKVGADIKGLWDIYEDNSICENMVSNLFSVYDIVVNLIDNGELAEEIVNGAPVIRVKITETLNTKEDERSDMVFLYWFDKETLSLVRYEENIPDFGYSKKADIQIISIDNIVLPDGEDGIKALIPDAGEYRIEEHKGTIEPKKDEDE